MVQSCPVMVQSCPLRFVFLLCCSELLWTALNCSRRFRGIDQEIFTNICKRVLAKTGGKDLIKVIPPMATKTLTYLIHFDTVFEYLWRPLFNRFMFTVFLHRVTQRQVFLQPLRITSIQWKMRRPETPVMLCQVLSAYWDHDDAASCMNHYDMSWSSPSGTCSWSRELVPCEVE